MAIEVDLQMNQAAVPLSCYCCGEELPELGKQEVADASEYVCEAWKDPSVGHKVTYNHLWTDLQSFLPLTEQVVFEIALGPSVVPRSFGLSWGAVARHFQMWQVTIA